MIREMKKWSKIIGFGVAVLTYFVFLRINYQNYYDLSRLDEAGKEAMLYSENAFYYKYYKDWASGIDLFGGFSKYPLMAEAVLSQGYRMLDLVVDASKFDFYMNSVLLAQSLGCGFVFLIVHELTGSWLAAWVAVLLQMLNLNYGTRVLYLPALRENFGIPLMLSQLYLLIIFLRDGSRKKFLGLLGVLVLMLKTWQFSVFILASEGLVSLLILVMNKKYRKLGLKLALGLIIGLGMVWLVGGRDYGHTFDYFLFQMGVGEGNFHLMMYKCSGAFDFINMFLLGVFTKSLLLPLAVFGILGQVIEKGVKKEKMLVLGLGLVLSMFAVVANRFLVLAAPLWTIMAAALFSRSFWEKLWQGQMTKVMLNYIVGALLILFLINSYLQLKLIMAGNKIGAYYAKDTNGELYEWIEKNTDKDAMLAAPMEIEAQIRLQTDRKIAINPYYEDKENKAKTFDLYRVYGKETEDGYYKVLKDNSIDLLVVSKIMCQYRSNNGCMVDDLYKFEDVSKDGTILCRTIGDSEGKWKTVFENSGYKVLRID